MDDLLVAVRDALDRVGDRWTLLIVAALLGGARRFADLEAAIDGIAPSVLSQRLRAMEAEGLVVAAPYQQRPLRLDYELTARGHELLGPLRLLASWSAGTGGPEHATCGTPLDVVWWCPTCEAPGDAPESDLHHL